MTGEVTQRERAERQRKVSKVPSTTSPDRAEEKLPSLSQLSVLQPSLGKEMVGNLNAPGRTGKAPFPPWPCPERAEERRVGMDVLKALLQSSFSVAFPG